MKLTNRIIEAYLNCHYKAFLLLAGHDGVPHDYEVLISQLQDDHRPQAREALLRHCGITAAPSIPVVSPDVLQAGFPLILDCSLDTGRFDFQFDGLLKVANKSASPHYQPVMFCYGERPAARHKLLLAYGAQVLADMQETRPAKGLIVFGSPCHITRVKLQHSPGLLKTIETDLFASSQPTAPPFFLNRHCPQCEFRELCRQKALAEDHLSLLSRMTPKQMAALKKKGIFTVSQLSHTFRPRRKSKRHRHLRSPHSIALQALAIRENKIHVVGTPDLPKSPVRLYVDVEGLFEGRFIYLIGALVDSGEDVTTHSFWADTPEQEPLIFEQLLALLGQYEDATVFHYGAYEIAFFKRMRKQTQNELLAQRLIDQSCNVLSLIRSSIYFPTYSNSLKDIAGYLGFRWSDPLASGLRSTVWRQQWQRTNDASLKDRLIKYNLDDCRALEVLMDCIHRIADFQPPGLSGSEPPTDIAWVAEKSPFPVGREWKYIDFAIPDYDYVNKAAYFDYQRERVYVRTNPRLRRSIKKRKVKRRGQGQRPHRRVELTCERCEHCGSATVRKTGKRTFSKRTYDIKCISSGIVRRVTEFYAKRVHCPDCRRTYLPSTFRRLDPYRHSLKGWAMYQHVVHRTSIPKLDLMLRDFFGIEVTQAYIHMMKALLARHFEPTYSAILRRLLAGTLIHADETELKLMTSTGYVWANEHGGSLLLLQAITRGRVLEGDAQRLSRGLGL